MRGLAYPSTALLVRSTRVADAPLWPTVDGPPDHRVQFLSSAVEQVVTPCSRNSTRLQAELLKKVAGEQAVVLTGELSFTIAGSLVQRLPVRDIATGAIVGEAVYSFANTSLACEEDPQISLTSELASLLKSQASHPGTSSNSTSASSGPSLGVILGSVAAGVCGLAAAAAAAMLFVRRRRRLRRPALRLGTTQWAAGEAPGASTPLAAQGELAVKRSSSMELGEAIQSEEEVPAGLPQGADTPLVPPHEGSSSAAAKDTLWRSKFGAVEGLEIYDLLGRGAFGRVYRGRWNGAVVAVKVVEHQVAAGQQTDILREPLLSLTVSHPNCCTAYKLAIVRLLEESHPKPALLVLGDHHGATPLEHSEGSDAAPCSSIDSEGNDGECGQEGQAAAAGSDRDDAQAPPKTTAPAPDPTPEPQGRVEGEGGVGSAGSAGSTDPKPTNSSRGGRPPRPPNSLPTAGSPGHSSRLATASNAQEVPAQVQGARRSSSGGSASASELARQGSRERQRRLQAIVSGGAAVEVVSPSDVLSPGLFETWIISEYCDRGSLGEALAAGRLWLANAGEPDLVAVYLTLLDIAQGCDYLHNSLNILHGDLKPANVLLKGARNDRRGFTCKLADFGLSRLLSEAQNSIHTQTFGTPSYAPPEALLQGRVSQAGDVYAFGIIMWECLSPPGDEPYPDLMVVQLVLGVAQGQRPAPPDNCHPPLQALMERCWAQEPWDRPCFTEVVRELRSQLQELRTRREQGQQAQQAQQGQQGQQGRSASAAASGSPPGTASDESASPPSTAPGSGAQPTGPVRDS